MRKITKESIDAFYSRKRFKRQNMEVVLGEEYVKLKLHGNTIATLDELNTLTISTCGWNTNTTRDRLNGLRGVHVKSIKGNLLLNGKLWDGKQITINQL
jgi:hypothetical protein